MSWAFWKGSLMFVITGILGVLIGVFDYVFPAGRNVEDTLPDHDVKTKPSSEALVKTDDRQVKEQAN